jgi:carboxyl-terminal processing protease
MPNSVTRVHLVTSVMDGRWGTPEGNPRTVSVSGPLAEGISMPRIRRAALAAVVLVPLVAGAFVVQERATREGGRLFSQVLDLVSSRFVDTVDATALYEKAARGLVSQLQDPYSELMSPRQLKQFNTNTAGRYGGLGMRIEEQPGKGVTVVVVFPSTPAEAAGIREGDLIVGVDTLSTRGWNSRRVADSLTGEPGTKVNVTFARPGVPEPIKATFTRALIRVPAVPYAIVFDDKIGYIPLQGFNETSTNELGKAVQGLEQQGVRGLVLDLRNNPGGFLDQALSISNLFLKQGMEIASVRGRNAEPQTYFAREKPVAPSLPLVILTDQYSASASEIVAGALQDHDRAVIVGTTSFGKGLVQTLFPSLEGGYALKMTTGKWYTPSGRSIQKERRLTDDGAYVEVHPDSVDSDSARRDRPIFRSDAGRVVYGGGAITPDLVVQPDTFTTAEQNFRRATASRSQDIYVTLYDYAYELKAGVRPDFVIRAEWRSELYQRLRRKGIELDRSLYDGAARLIDRDLELRIARLAFGDSTARRRSLDDDSQLRAAIDLLRRGQSQQDLFALVATNTRR